MKKLLSRILLCAVVVMLSGVGTQGSSEARPSPLSPCVVAIILSNHALEAYNDCNVDLVQLAWTGGCVELYNAYLESTDLVRSYCNFSQS